MISRSCNLSFWYKAWLIYLAAWCVFAAFLDTFYFHYAWLYKIFVLYGVGNLNWLELIFALLFAMGVFVSAKKWIFHFFLCAAGLFAVPLCFVKSLQVYVTMISLTGQISPGKPLMESEVFFLLLNQFGPILYACWSFTAMACVTVLAVKWAPKKIWIKIEGSHLFFNWEPGKGINPGS